MPSSYPLRPPQLLPRARPDKLIGNGQRMLHLAEEARATLATARAWRIARSSPAGLENRFQVNFARLKAPATTRAI